MKASANSATATASKRKTGKRTNGNGKSDPQPAPVQAAPEATEEPETTTPEPEPEKKKQTSMEKMRGGIDRSLGSIRKSGAKVKSWADAIESNQGDITDDQKKQIVEARDLMSEAVEALAAAVANLESLPADIKLPRTNVVTSRFSEGEAVNIRDHKLYLYEGTFDEDPDDQTLVIKKFIADGKRVVVQTKSGVRVPVSIHHIKPAGASE